MYNVDFPVVFKVVCILHGLTESYLRCFFFPGMRVML